VKGFILPKLEAFMLEDKNTEFEGGNLNFGISDDERVVGIDNADAEILRMANSFRDSLSPDPLGQFSAAPIVMDGKTVIEFTIERGDMLPYCFKEYGLVPKGVFVRLGNKTVSTSRDHIKQMIRDNDKEKFVAGISLNQSLTFEYAGGGFS
jgi:predicted HTH transcriptional regulator